VFIDFTAAKAFRLRGGFLLRLPMGQTDSITLQAKARPGCVATATGDVMLKLH
jgi:hypothetical protein